MKQRTKKLFTLILVASLIAGMFGLPSQAKKATYKIVLPKKTITAYVGQSIRPAHYVVTPSGRMSLPAGLKATSSDKKKAVPNAEVSEFGDFKEKTYSFSCKKPGTVKITYRYKGAKAVLKINIYSTGVVCPETIWNGSEEELECYGKVFESGNFSVTSSNTKVLKIKKDGSEVSLRGIRHGKATVIVKTKNKTRKFSVVVPKIGKGQLEYMNMPAPQRSGKDVKSFSIRLKNNGTSNIRITHAKVSGWERASGVFWLKKPVLIKPGKTVKVTFDNYTLSDGTQMKDIFDENGFLYTLSINGYYGQGVLPYEEQYY